VAGGFDPGRVAAVSRGSRPAGPTLPVAMPNGIFFDPEGVADSTRCDPAGVGQQGVAFSDRGVSAEWPQPPANRWHPYRMRSWRRANKFPPRGRIELKRRSRRFPFEWCFHGNPLRSISVFLPLPRRERVGVRVMRHAGWCVSRRYTPHPRPLSRKGARGEARHAARVASELSAREVSARVCGPRANERLRNFFACASVSHTPKCFFGPVRSEEPVVLGFESNGGWPLNGNVRLSVQSAGRTGSAPLSTR
jgi:hypothetical protein